MSEKLIKKIENVKKNKTVQKEQKKIKMSGKLKEKIYSIAKKLDFQK